MFEDMITFEQFVKSLGEGAMSYTAEQLRRLHADVGKMARVLIAIHRTHQATIHTKGETVGDRP